MELKAFVSETLTQIIDGIEEAQTHALTKGAKINPHSELVRVGDDLVAQGPGQGTTLAQLVNIDVALTARSTDKAAGKVELQVASLALGPGVSGEIASGKETVSRVSFSIPVIFPAPK